MNYIPDQNLVKIGEDCIRLFHNESVTRFPEIYKISFNELLEKIKNRTGGKAFLEGLGLGIQSAEISLTKQNMAMKELAKKAQGKIPAKNQDFFLALSDISQVQTFSDIGSASFEIFKGSVVDVFEGAQKVGDTTLKLAEGIGDSAVSVASNLKWILPALAFLVVGIFAYSASKKV